MTPEQYIREAIQQFVADPPDSSYQEGYSDALLTIAREAFGMSMQEVQRKAGLPRQMDKFVVIDGGKRDA